MTRVVKIDKRLSNGRLAEYILDIREINGETVCSIEISVDSEASSVYDVCRDTDGARKILQMLADGEAEPCHLQDIIYDMLPL